MKTVALGSRGPEVCLLQSRLNSQLQRLPHPLSVDGIFGLKTLARAIEFQNAAQLKPDGIVGAKTWGALLVPEPLPRSSSRFCDDILGTNGMAHSTPLVSASFSESTASPPPTLSLAGFSLPSIPSLPRLRTLTPSELAIATGVYGSSIDFSTVFLSDKTGLGGRAFVLAVPVPFGKTRQIVNAGHSPTRDTLIHELAHVWQSQHHSDSTRYMVNAVESQALAEATNALKGSTSFSAYGYRPGKPFGEYGAEQIAEQAMRGEPPIVGHMKAVSPGVVDADNVASLGTARIEDTSLPGVKT